MRPDGSLVWVSNTVTFIRAATGTAPGTVLVVVLDISARKHGEEALRNADRRKDEFLAMLAHELRNPLAPISAAADILAMTTPDANSIKITSGVIRRQVRHMSHLIDDLLDVSRVTRGLIKVDMSALDANSIVADAIEQTRPLIEEKRHRLEIELAPESTRVRGDQKRLVQVLANLLNNAAKYTPLHGTLRLRTEVDEHHVTLQVQDNGIGIEQDLQPHVFALFAQASRTLDRSQGGLGIGLALARRLVELHGGSLTCVSNGPGTGSLFSVRLPRLRDNTETAPRAASPSALAPATCCLRVLVVDDNTDAAYMISMFVEALGHEVHVEHDAQRGLDKAATIGFDICLLDIGLPGMDGNELARRLRAQATTTDAMLVAVSGYAADEDKEVAYRAGFDRYFAKPVDITVLAALLQNIGQRRTQRQ